jgi:hypothetical protein
MVGAEEHRSGKVEDRGRVGGHVGGGVQARRRPWHADMRQVLDEMPIRRKLVGGHGFKFACGHGL